MTDANSLLMGSGAPSAKFENVGDVVKGVITDTGVSQQRDYATGEPLWWDEGKTEPKQQVVITLSTDLRDPEIEGDDGTRRLYAPTWNKPGSLFDAIRKAVKAAGADGLAKGGKLAVKFSGEEAPEKRGFNPRKVYVAQYEPPAAGADLFAGGDASPAPVAEEAGVAADDLL